MSCVTSPTQQSDLARPRSQRQNVERNSLEWKPSLMEAREVQSCRCIIRSWMLFFVCVRHRGLHVTVRCRSASWHEWGDVAVPPSVHQEQKDGGVQRKASSASWKERDSLLMHVAGGGRTSCTLGCCVLQHTRAGQRPWTMPLGIASSMGCFTSYAAISRMRYIVEAARERACYAVENSYHRCASVLRHDPQYVCV